MDPYQVGISPQELRSAILSLRDDFEAHIHDGTSSRLFQTITANTVSAQAMLVRKTSFSDTTNGIWMGLVDGLMKLNLGNASSYLQWSGSSLSIVGSITATSGTIGGWTIGATTLTGGGVTLDSSGTITGGVIRTSSGSSRVQMSSSTNTLDLYESNVQRVSLGSTYLGFLNSSGTLVSTIQASSAILAVDASLTAGGSVQMNANSSGKVSLNINSSVYFFADGPNGLNQSKTIVPLAGTTQDLGSSGSMWNDFYLRNAKQPVLYFGYISGTTLSESNVSWTITNPSTGKYTLTHNFATTNYTAVVTALRASGAGAYSAKVEARNSNSLQVTIFDDTGTVQASDFMFLITKI